MVWKYCTLFIDSCSVWQRVCTRRVNTVIDILYVLNTEYETERKPGNTSGGPPAPRFVQPPPATPSPPMFDLASLVFLAEFYSLTIRRSRPRYLLRRAGGREKENQLWGGAPGRKRGRGVGRAWGFLKPRHPFFSPSCFSFLFFLSLGFLSTFRGGRGKAEGKTAFLLWENQAAARSQLLALSSGPESGPLSSPAPSRSFCLRDSLRDRSRASSSPLSPLPGFAGAVFRGPGERDMCFLVFVFVFCFLTRGPGPGIQPFSRFSPAVAGCSGAPAA